MNPTKTIIKKIKLQIPNHVIHVVFTDNPTAYYKSILLSKYPKLPPLDGTATALQSENIDDYPNKSWIVLPHNPSKGLIVHEVIHAVDAIMAGFGFEGSEFRAYYVEYLTTCLGVK